MRVRICVRAGSSVEVSRRGTQEMTGYIVVVDSPGDVLDGEFGEFAGVRRGERCFDAAALNFLGDSRGDGAGLEEGQLIVYPAGSDEGWISNDKSQTPE